jgi:cell division cycle protein 20 (cofactor of APC complex)
LSSFFQTSARLDVLYSSNRAVPDRAKVKAANLRHIPSAPTRILDAPDLIGGYYLNLVSWSCDNIIAVALGPAVYLWNAKSGAIEELMALEDETVSNAHRKQVRF